MKLPERLKKLRNESGSTQDEIAALLNVRRSTYGEYERGKIRPPASKLFLLAEHYGASVDYLMGISDERRSKQIYEEDVGTNLVLFINWVKNPLSKAVLDGSGLSLMERDLVRIGLESTLASLKAARNLNNLNKPEHENTPSELGE